jgi:hypothetical protein
MDPGVWLGVLFAAIAAYYGYKQDRDQKRYVRFLKRVLTEADEGIENSHVGRSSWPVRVDQSEIDLALRAVTQDFLVVYSGQNGPIWEAQGVRLMPKNRADIPSIAPPGTAGS